MLKKINSFLILLTALLCFGAPNAWGDELTIANGTSTSQYYPVYGSWADNYVRSQMIYPATMLSSIEGKKIDGMTFHIKTVASEAWTSNFQVRVANVPSGTNYASSTAWNTTEGTLVYEGTLDGRQSTMAITFSSPFTYEGGALLVEVKNTTTGNYPAPYFFGASQSSYTAVYGKNSSSMTFNPSSRTKFLPKVTIEYSDAAPITCPKPSALTQGIVTHNSAAFTWTAGGSESSWQYVYLPAATTLTDEAWEGSTAGSVNTAAVSLNGLSAATDYKLYVRAYCSATDQSAYIYKQFRTNNVIPFSEDFTGLTSGIPAAWDNAEGTTSTASYRWNYNNSGHDAAPCVRFNSSTNGSGNTNILKTPTIYIDKAAALSFWYKNPTGGDFSVYYSIDGVKQADALATGLTGAADWTNYEVVLPTACVGHCVKILFQGTSNYGSSTAYIYLDDVVIEAASSCVKPTALSAYATAYNQASVSWTAGGEETAWNLQFSTDNFDTYTSVDGISANPYVLTGLTANTTYKVRIQADCGSAQSGWVASSAFATPCEPINGIGWGEDFEAATAGSGKIPDCWQKNTANNSYPQVSSTSSFQKTGSTKCLYFDGGALGSERIAILPPFNEETNTFYVTLDYSQAYESYGWPYDYSGEDYGQLAIGYMTNPADASTFTAKETLPRVNAYTTASVALTGAPANAYVALRYAGGDYSGYLFVDNISISAIPSCVAPSGAKGVVSSSNSATISWTENGSATAWKVRYSSDNEETWSSEIAANANPFELTGLEASTTYVVQVMSICGEEESSNWSASSASFNTPCGQADASDYSENFENAPAGSGKLPDCWSYKQSVTLYSSTYPYVYNYSGEAYDGSDKSLSFYGGTSSSEQIVVMPEMDQALNELTLELYYSAPASEYSTRAKLEVGYIAADGTTYNTVETLDYADAYTQYTKILSSVPADAKNIAFRYAGGASNSSAYIDNVRVYPTPTCATPTAVAAANFTANSAAISWTANASESAWKVQYSTDGTNWTDANEGNAVNDNPYTLNGLAANTVYYARVKAVCSATDESPWSEASAAFRTDCNAITVDAENDWVEGFEANAIGNSTSAAPYCWALLNANEGDYPYIYVNGGSYAHNSDKALFFNNKHLVNSFAIFPEFTNALNTLQISFWHMEENGTKSGYLEFGYMTDIADANTFTLLRKCERSGSSYVMEEVSLASVPDGARLAFRYIGVDTQYEWYSVVDDITISLAPACPQPKNVTAVAASATAATVSWTEFGSATAWQIQYRSGSEEWTLVENVNTNPFTLEGLNPSTTYDVQVRAYCSESEQSEWTSATSYFTTDCEYKAIGWSEDFDAQNALPLCWDNSTYSGTQWSVDNYDEYHSNPYSARYNGRTYTSYSADLVTPSVVLDKEAMLVFWYRNDVTAELYINDGTTTSQLMAIPSQTSWTEAKVDLSAYKGKTVSFIFRGHGVGTSTTKYMYLDDIGVVRALPQNTDLTAELATLEGQTLDVLIGRTFFKGVGNNTICLPFSLPTLDGTPLEGGTLLAFKYGYVENGELLLRVYPAESMEAGVPYLISWEDGDNIVNPIFTSVTIAAAQGKSVGENNDVQFVGIFAPEIFPQDDKTKLFMLTNDQIAWSGVEANVANSLKSFRAYFQTNTAVGSTSSNAPIRHGMPARIVMQEQVATGMENVQGENKAVKLLENDQVVIIRNGKKYNAAGQLVK